MITSPSSSSKSNASYKKSESSSYSKITVTDLFVSETSDLESIISKENENDNNNDDNCYVIVDTVECMKKKNNKYYILHQMSASLQSQSITAIIGPKGSGKVSSTHHDLFS